MTRRGTRSPVERQDPPASLGVTCSQAAYFRQLADEHAASCLKPKCELSPADALVAKLVPRYVEDPHPCNKTRRDSTGVLHLCVLLATHDGRHSDGELRWSDEIEPEPKSCGAVNGDAVCSLPLDHHGRHRGDLTSWENP